MNLAATIDEGLRAGVLALRDVRLWQELATTARRPATLLKAAGILALLGLWNVLAAVLFNGTLGLAVSAGLAIWICPPVLRWFVGLIARRAAWPLVRTLRPAQRQRPAVAEYRKWWTPVLVADAAWRFAQRLGLDDSLPVIALAVIAVQSWLAGPAFARSLLVSWFDPARIDESIATQRRRWTLLAAAFLAALALLQFIATRALGLTGRDLFMGWLAASPTQSLLPQLLAKLALLVGVMVVAAAYLTAVASAIATRWMLGESATATATTSPSASRRLPYAIGGALLLAVMIAFTFRAQLAYWALGNDFRALVAAQGNQGWDDPQIRQWTRRALACEGDTTALRVLHLAGVNASHWVDDSALSCPIARGDLATLRAMLAIGDSPDHLQRIAGRDSANATEMTPLQQAFTQARWEPLAEALVDAGATMQPRRDGELDAVQSAAAAHCLPCLEWLKRRGASFAGTNPATPMALWLDGASADADRTATLKRLAAMDMSAKAVGADGRSALHAAARLGDPDAVGWILAQGADATTEDKHRNTALAFAAFRVACCNPGQPETPAQQARLQAVRQLMPVSGPIAADRPALREELARPGENFEDAPVWPVPGLPTYAPSTLNPRFWSFADAAARSTAIRARAHELGWKIKYESAESLVRSLPPADAQGVLADLPDEDLGQLLSTASDLTQEAITRRWWPELVRAAPRWEHELHYGKPDCLVLARLVAGENDPSPQAATSWSLVHAWFQAGAHLSLCKQEARLSVDHAAASLPAARRAEWDALVRADGGLADLARRGSKLALHAHRNPP